VSPPRVGLGITVGVVASLLAAGCQSAGVTDKTGGNVTVLQFATIDKIDPNGQTVAPGTFIEALERLSGGRFTITVQATYEDGAVTAETDIVEAIASGELDGGWPGTRAFSRAGIRGLEPVEAPMTLTSYAAQKELATSSAGQALLKTLDGSGVVGLGLAVGPLRRPWAATKPLVDIQHWHGVTFRSYNSPVHEDTIRALDAVPVPASFHFPELVRAGTLQAVELDVAQYARNGGYSVLLPWAVGNVVLWPRMAVLLLSQKRFDSLTAEQQGWVRDAAEQAVQASVDFGYDEATPAGQLCEQGVRFIDATPEQLTALRRAVQPVLDALAQDPATGPSLTEVEKVAADFPNPDVVDVPAGCREP
jgi:TRAP-type C4-dicarboxylate transport system substrate-binding protein